MRRRAMLVLLAMAAALVVAGGVAYGLGVECDGPGDQDPDSGQCTGTAAPDVIDGTQDPDTIGALAGDDIVFALGGNDTVHGDEGSDLIDGFSGKDAIYGGPDGDGSANGTDFGDPDIANLEGGQDSDKVYGNAGNDFIDAAADDEPSQGQPEPVDRGIGGIGNDRIYAVDGNVDIINCGKGKRDVAFIDKGIDTTTGCEKKHSEA